MESGTKGNKKAAVASGGSSDSKRLKSYKKSGPITIFEAIEELVGGGLSPVPIDHTTKKPAMDLLPRGWDGRPAWAPFRQHIADEEMRKQWAAYGIQAVAVVCGAGSGDLLVLDFDVPRFYEAWVKLVGDLANGLPVQRTGGGGYQVFLRCPDPGGNQRLAWAPDDNDPTGRTIAIETRGEGGYAVVPPSLHPTGNYYKMISGSLANVPVVTQEVADALLAAARELDEMPHTIQLMEQMQAQACAKLQKARTKKKTGGSVIDAFKAAHDVEELLEKHGYTPGPGGRYVRPGGSSASVKVQDGRSTHWSTNDELNDGKFTDGMGVHDAFSIFTQLDHGGDVSAAVRAAAKEMNMNLANSGAEELVSISVDNATIELKLSYDFPFVNGSAKGQITVHRDGKLLHQDRVDLSSATSRKRFCNAIAAKLVSPKKEDAKTQTASVIGTLDAALLSKLDKLSEMASAGPESASVAEPDHQALLDDMSPDARAEAEDMLKDPNLLLRIVDDIARMGVAGEKKLATTIYLIGVSRRLPKTLGGRIHGHTATGKSFVADQTSRLFPPEAVIYANQMTPQALYHMSPGSLKNRWIVCGERSRLENEDSAEATRALRELQASGKLSKLMPIKVGNGIETLRIEQEGPIAFTESTTLSRVFGEDANRCLNLCSDEQEEQTRRIIRAEANESEKPNDVTPIILRHNAIQRMIARVPAKVHIPFARQLAGKFPTNRPEARRAFGQVLSMVKAVTLLHHRQREQNEQGAYIATADDYRIAKLLLDGPMGRAIGGNVSDGARRLWRKHRNWAGTNPFSTSALYKRAKFSDHAVRGWLLELARAGVLEEVEQGGKGKPYLYKAIHVCPADEDETETDDQTLSVLPLVEDVVCGSGSLSDCDLAKIFNNDRKPDQVCVAIEVDDDDVIIEGGEAADDGDDITVGDNNDADTSADANAAVAADANAAVAAEFVDDLSSYVDIKPISAGTSSRRSFKRRAI